MYLLTNLYVCIHLPCVCLCVHACLSRPIKPGTGGQKKTFEELLEEQLRLEEQRLKSAWQQQVRQYNKGDLRNSVQFIAHCECQSQSRVTVLKL